MNKLKLAVALLLGVALAVGTVAVLVALPRPGTAPASIPWRQTAGPPGGHVRGVIYHPTDPQIAYASAGRAGFYRSADGGRTWQASIQGLPAGASIGPLATSPSTPSVVLVAIEQQGIFRSTDTGLTWSVLNPTPFRTVRALAASPNYATDKTAFLAWFSTPRGGPPEHGVVKLMDTMAMTVTEAPAQTLVLTPNYDDDGPNLDVYLGVRGSLWRSSDGGRTWTDNRPIRDEQTWIWELAVSPHFAADRTLFAGTDPYPASAYTNTGLFKSTDGGLSWTPIGDTIAEGLTIARIVLVPDYDDGDHNLDKPEPNRVWLGR